MKRISLFILSLVLLLSCSEENDDKIDEMQLNLMTSIQIEDHTVKVFSYNQ